MDQINQLKTNLRQTRNNLNSVIGQINQQLQNSEQIVDNLGTQMVNQQKSFSQFGSTSQFGQQPGSSFASQPYNPKFTGSTSLSSTGPGYLNQGKQYSNQPSSMQGGFNQYGAKYNSGKIDTDVGQSYYQSAQNQRSGFAQNPVQQNTGSQYNPNQISQSNFNQPSSQRNYGVNQYGALYNSGNQDEDIGQSYYQS
ncbi:MAG TPA: hypothetical protein VKY40_03545 [Halanaerobiales bacterium]|nr:hypothetical protein [Halanaerobiales bacterium]